jgi:hypothetical protein
MANPRHNRRLTSVRPTPCMLLEFALTEFVVVLTESRLWYADSAL